MFHLRVIGTASLRCLDCEGFDCEVHELADRKLRELAALFATTTTIGARYWPVQRPALPRTETEIEWRGQKIRRKDVVLPDGNIMKVRRMTKDIAPLS